MSVFNQIATPSDGVAWVTGASAGIGRALVLRLADDGWTVYATARGEAALQDLASQRPGLVIPAAGDVCDAARMTEIADQIASSAPIALAVLNAGVYLPMRAQTFSAADARRTFDVNLTGVANPLEPLLKQMIERRAGHIALTASVAGFRGLPRAAAYSASKAGLIAMAEALAFDLIDLGVRISVINPGFVETEATSVNDFDMPFLISPEDAADRIVRGLKSPGFAIDFPRRFTIPSRLLGMLPNRAYFWVMRKLLRWDGKV